MNIGALTVNQIKTFLAHREEKEIGEEILLALAGDPRTAVRQIYTQYQKGKAAWQKELERLQELHKYETDLLQKGYRYIAGTDEVGRGPLAGPVMAAAVILAPDTFFPGLNDSKKVTPAKREELAAQIKEKALAWQVVSSSVEEIDRINILQASLLAMNKAINSLSTQPEFVLVDAVTIPGMKIPQLPIIRGDSLSASIAAASVLAKVTRDELMRAYSKEYPEYGFEQHKGYGTAEHMEAIRSYGPCPIHRRTFLKFMQV